MNLVDLAHLWAVYKLKLYNNQVLVEHAVHERTHTMLMADEERRAATMAGRMRIAAGGDNAYDVAEKLALRRIKVTPQAIYRWMDEEAPSTPSDENLAAFCAAYGVDEAWVRYGIAPPGERSAILDSGGALLDEMPAGVAEQTIDFVEFLLLRPELKLTPAARIELREMCARVRADQALKRARGG